MTETTTRIRWERNDDGSTVTAAWEGSIGKVDEAVFWIFEPTGSEPWWILTSSLPGQGRYRVHNDEAEALKRHAGRWLGEFATSLGAVFPDEPDESAAFQVSDTLALWDRNRAGEPVTSRERVLADQVRTLLAIVSPHCTCPCNCPASGRRDDDGTPGWCDSCRMNIHAAHTDPTPGATGTEE